MVKIDIKDFKSVELQRGVLTIHGGGHLTKTMSLLTKEVTATGSGQGSVAATYVHIRSREPWLSQAVRAWCEYHAGDAMYRAYRCVPSEAHIGMHGIALRRMPDVGQATVPTSGVRCRNMHHLQET